MTDPRTRERRPAQAPNPTNTTEPSLPSAEADRTQARCARCGHPIFAPASLASGYGKDCRRLLDLDDLEAVAR